MIHMFCTMESTYIYLVLQGRHQLPWEGWRLRPSWHSNSLYNYYGATEICKICHYFKLLREDTHKKKWHGPLSHWCREGKTLVVRPLNKTLFLCVSSLREAEKKEAQKLVTALNKICTLHSAIHVYHRCLTINSVCILTFIFSNRLYFPE